ncbi:MAG: amino acid-binding protein [Bacteroidaceae bacterium]|nr:amino acid-binding protein [Bacteroidaceae bacterium]
MKQLSIFLQNESGTLTSVLDILADAGIQLYAVSIADTSDYGICRLICDKPDEALAILRNAGHAVSQSDVRAIIIGDTPGAAAETIRIFAKEHLSLAYLYTFLYENKPVLVFRTDDKEKASDIILRHGLKSL